MQEEKLNKLPLEEPEHIKILSEHRMTICRTCNQFTSLQFCNECSCFMPIKTTLPWVKCPVGRW
jgi:hypothetical protein